MVRKIADYTLSAKITGDASEFVSAIKTAENAESKFSSSMEKIGRSVESVGKSLTSKVTKPALIAGAALGKLTLWNGFQRLTTIDDAKTKMEALGLSAKDTASIMGACNKAVTGTAFGLDEAAKVAASAGAAGVKAGADMEKYLKRVANTASAAGSSMSEIGYVLNKVRTNGRATNEELMELADRGIDAYGMLAKQMGTTKDSIRDMASSGSISCDQLETALDSLGDAAKKMGTSFSAEVKNLKASFSRIGANFLDAGGTGGGMFSQLKTIIPEITSVTKRFESVASIAGASAGKSFAPLTKAIQNAVQNFNKLSDTQVQSIAKTAGVGYAFATALGPAIEATGKFMQSVSAISGVTGRMKSTVSGLFSGLANSFKSIDPTPFQKAFSTIKSGLSSTNSAFKTFGAGLKEWFGNSAVFQKFSGAASTAFSKAQNAAANAFAALDLGFNNTRGKIGNFANDISSKFAKLANSGGMFSGFAENISKSFGNIGTRLNMTFSQSFGIATGKLQNFISTVGAMAAEIFPVFAKAFNVAAFVGLITAAFGAINMATSGQFAAMITTFSVQVTTMLSNVVNLVTTYGPTLMASGTQAILALVNGLISALPQLLIVGVQIISQLVMGISAALPQLIPAAVNCVLSLVSALLSNVGSIISAGLQLIQGLAVGVVSAIPIVAQKAPQVVQRLVSAIVSNLPQLISAGVKLIVALAKGLIQAIPSVVAAVPRIIVAIVRGFTSHNWGGVGGNIVKGIASGLSSFAGTVYAKAQAIADKIKSILNIKAHIAAFFSIHQSKKAHGGRVNAPHYAGGGYKNALTPIMMNEGGRGELAALPNGTMIVPHDISETYAKQAAKMAQGSGTINNSNVSITVYGAPGQNVNELAEIIEKKLANSAARAGGVFA